jgi:hypothetical protein
VQYSLLHRFQGGLFGSLAGETLFGNTPQKLSRGSEIAVSAIARTMASGKLSIDNWERPSDFCEGEIAVAMLPALLFFHDNYGLCQEHLQDLAASWGLKNETVEDVLIWGEAIALALREKLVPQQLLTHINHRYRAAQTPLIEQLARIQTFLEQATPLAQVVSQMTRQKKSESTAIALAFYCFACTPEDFRLCLMRATKMGKQAATIAALTGALAGVYNSASGIPIAWRVAIKKDPIGQQLVRGAIALFAIWSGAYRLDNSNLLPEAAIASPLAMQPRPSLKIISQEEYSRPDTFLKVDSKVIKK